MRRMESSVGKVQLGARVVVRHRLPAPDAVGHTLTDVVGELVGVDADSLTVATRRGEVVVPLASVTVVKPIPPRASRRGAAHRALSVEAMQEVMVDAWGALERAWLGRWQLRAGGGYTQRANSIALLGDPGIPLTDAVDRSVAWYAARSLPLNVTLAGPVGFAVEQDPFGVELLARGATVTERCLTLTADAGAVVEALALPLPSPGPLLSRPRESSLERALTRTQAGDEEVSVEVTEDVSDDWLAAHHGYRCTGGFAAAGAEDDSWAATARAVLMGSPAQLFATLRDTAGEVIGVGRAGLTPGWVGLGSIWVKPTHRRQGLARVISHALLDEALHRGHRSAHLQVLETNAAARALYEAIDFQPHHDYVNLVLPT